MPENPDMKMFVMTANDMTDAKLISSNIPETDHAAWAVGTTYAANARVIVLSTHSIYESIAGGNVGHDPVADVNPVTGVGTYWLRVGATNRWKAFDKRISDSVGTSLNFIGYSFMPGAACDTIALFSVGSSRPATIVVYVDGNLAIDEPVGSGTFIITGLILTDVSVVTVDVVDDAGAGGLIVIGQIAFGRSVEIGELQTGGVVGFTDYSKKERDDFGNLTIIERGYAAKVDYQVAIPTDQTNTVSRILSSVRAKPAVYHGGEASVQYGMVQLGILNDFTISQPNMTISNLAISVDGLT